VNCGPSHHVGLAYWKSQARCGQLGIDRIDADLVIIGPIDIDTAEKNPKDWY